MCTGEAISHVSAKYYADLFWLRRNSLWETCLGDLDTCKIRLFLLYPSLSYDFVLHYRHSVLSHMCLLHIVWEFTCDLKL